MSLLAIDPGTRGCGAAIFRNGALQIAAFVPNTAKEGSGPRECAAMAHAVVEWCLGICETGIDKLALEAPQIYSRGGGKSIGDPNYIMPLFGVVSAIAALFPIASVDWERPRGWKGNTPKPEKAEGRYVIRDRVIERLDLGERVKIRWPSNFSDTKTALKQDWDVADAVGIGLHLLGRFERKQIFARE